MNINVFDMLKFVGHAPDALKKITQSIDEIKKLIGDGKVTWNIEKNNEELHITIRIVNPTLELGTLAEKILLILPAIKIKGVHITLDMVRGEQKLLKEVFP